MIKQKLIKIGKAAEILGTTPGTLRKWEKTGELLPARKTKGGTRYYDLNKLLESGTNNYRTICYARVPTKDQLDDLARQQNTLETYCATKGWITETITDVGSGINYRKKGLNKLLNLILDKKIKRLVITHKDRLLRFGSELIFTLCELQGIEIIIIHQGPQPSFEEELTKDVLEAFKVIQADIERTEKIIKTMEETK